jgi:hypothetical protein
MRLPVEIDCDMHFLGQDLARMNTESLWGTAGRWIVQPRDAKESSERDQLWATLRALRPEIDRLALGQLEPGQRHDQLAQVLARVVAAELDFREREFSA